MSLTDIPAAPEPAEQRPAALYLAEHTDPARRAIGVTGVLQSALAPYTRALGDACDWALVQGHPDAEATHALINLTEARARLEEAVLTAGRILTERRVTL